MAKADRGFLVVSERKSNYFYWFIGYLDGTLSRISLIHFDIRKELLKILLLNG